MHGRDAQCAESAPAGIPRLELHFINHHQTLKLLECLGDVLKTLCVGWVLQVEALKPARIASQKDHENRTRHVPFSWHQFFSSL